MQRLTAYLLIALVSLMAFVPQALCPCAVRARAQAPAVGAPAVHASSKQVRACCVRCLAALKPAQAPGERAPQSPVEPCPCCAINGQGKTLLTLGGAVRAEPPMLAGFLTALPAPALAALGVPVCTASRAVVPDDRPVPLLQRLASVVLLI